MTSWGSWSVMGHLSNTHEAQHSIACISTTIIIYAVKLALTIHRKPYKSIAKCGKDSTRRKLNYLLIDVSVWPVLCSHWKWTTTSLPELSSPQKTLEHLNGGWAHEYLTWRLWRLCSGNWRITNEDRRKPGDNPVGGYYQEHCLRSNSYELCFLLLWPNPWQEATTGGGIYWGTQFRWIQPIIVEKALRHEQLNPWLVTPTRSQRKGNNNGQFPPFSFFNSICDCSPWVGVIHIWNRSSFLGYI